MKAFLKNKWTFRLSLLLAVAVLLYSLLPRSEGAAREAVTDAIGKIKQYKRAKGHYPANAQQAGITRSPEVYYTTNDSTFHLGYTYGIMDCGIVRYASDADTLEYLFSY